MKNSLARAARCALLTALLSVLFCVTASAANPFTDVRRSDEYYTAVMWALDSGVTSGTSATTFSPGSTCNRGQVVTFLWRAAGQPEPASLTNPFTDVTSDSFCYKAALWAVQQGITNGTSATTFSPQNPCTYAHVITFLWRSARSPAAAGPSWLAQEYANLWYSDALAWAETNDILADTDITPGSPCPRWAIVSCLYRWAAPGSVLSLYPELSVDKDEISVYALQGFYRDGNIHFCLETQMDDDTNGPPVMFEISDDSVGGAIAYPSRVFANIYQAQSNSGDNYIIGFSRMNGTVYLDYYRNGVHMKRIPREPLDSAFESSPIPSFDAFLGNWTGKSDYEGDYNGRFELTMSRGEVRRGVEYCQFHLEYRSRLIWDAECAYDPSTGAMIMYTLEETDVHFDKSTGESAPETTELFNYGWFTLDEYGRLHLDLMDEDVGNLGWVLEEIEGTFIRR